MKLSKYNLTMIGKTGVEIPDEHIFNLPEKILQFGTGVLLRALPDYFVDKANRQGIFNGRILVVKSTSSGDTECLQGTGWYVYPFCSWYGKRSQPSISRSFAQPSAGLFLPTVQWSELLASAANPELGIVISNTTEVGIQLVKESIFQTPPASFPAKLLAFLYERLC